MKGSITAQAKLKQVVDRMTFLSRLEERGIVFPFPWQVVSTRELAELLGIHLQTLHNWNIRGKGPAPVAHGIWRGNRRYFRLADIIAWLEDAPTWQVYRDWINDRYTNADVSTPKETEAFINNVIATRAHRQPRWKLKRYGTLPTISLGG